MSETLKAIHKKRYGIFDETHYTIAVSESYDWVSSVLILADIHDMHIDELKCYIKESDVEAIFIPGDLCNEHVCPGGHNSNGKKNYGVSEKGLEFVHICAEKCQTFYSRGNHEWIFDHADIEAINNTGAVFLENSYISLGKKTYLGALGSPLKYERNGVFPEYYEPNMKWINGFARCDGYKILLSHHPEYYQLYLKNMEIDLIVSGHAHGGQIRIGNQGLWAPAQGLFPKLTCGFIDNKLLISRGLANTSKFIPRVNNRPEIVILHLVKE